MESVVHGSYGALLWDERWRAKRKRILARDGNRCVVCGSTIELTIHHKQYHVNENGQKHVPWDYHDKYLVTLCKKCHQSGHSKFKVPIFTLKK